ncbi:DUF7344 domain-containing protein [Halopiger goleimassiliensis]|uniref:DUF7344 domain-containing protein n=1 Tax=Halopiger goleimassiliensis TaxID=1293048 RepID=UPI0006778722|nr:hypothetical protein [Halopiger goleimassiliensis]
MTTSAPSGRSADARTECFQSLADPTRRAIVRLAHERSPEGIGKRDLATKIAAVTSDEASDAVTDDQHRRALLECHHSALPALRDAGLVTVVDETVRTTDHWLYDHPTFDAVVAGPTDDDEDLDAVYEALADERRRTVLSVLGAQYHPISTETLARDVAAREAGTTERDVSSERVASVRTSLVHAHLPLLAECGLVTYDAEDDHVSYQGHPELRAEWLVDGVTTAESSDDGDSSDDDADPFAETPDVETIDGRESIVTTGQSLCERADDELFVLVTASSLLEEGCLRRIEDAADRGVDVYLGTRDPTVRELVRERAPSVDLWEPALDWLTPPPERDAVGRLVLVDREAVLLGTFGRSSSDGRAFDERAILAEGVDNGLVVFVRQLLGSRFDHLEGGRSGFRSEIPL